MIPQKKQQYTKGVVRLTVIEGGQLGHKPKPPSRHTPRKAFVNRGLVIAALWVVFLTAVAGPMIILIENSPEPTGARWVLGFITAAYAAVVALIYKKMGVALKGNGY